MSYYLDIEKIVPANCPLEKDDCYYCEHFSHDRDGLYCYAPKEEEDEEDEYVQLVCPYCYDTDIIDSKNGLHRCLGCGNEF